MITRPDDRELMQLEKDEIEQLCQDLITETRDVVEYICDESEMNALFQKWSGRIDKWIELRGDMLEVEEVNKYFNICRESKPFSVQVKLNPEESVWRKREAMKALKYFYEVENGAIQEMNLERALHIKKWSEEFWTRIHIFGKSEGANKDWVELR